MRRRSLGAAPPPATTTWAVGHHLDEPHRVPIGPQPPARLTGARVAAGHPGLVGLAGQRRELLHPTGGGGVAARDAGALGQVVVIRPAPVGLQVGPGSRGRTGVDLHAAVHCQRHPTMTNKSPHKTPMGPAKRGPDYPYW